MIGLKKVVTTSSSNLLDHQAILFGVPRVPSYVPGGMSDANEKMTFTQRASNAIGSYFGAKLFLAICDLQTAVFQKHLGKEFPDLRTLVSQSALLFTNSQPYIDFPKPTLYKVIDIGGIHIKTKNTALNKEWEAIMSKNSKTILISFGSVAKSAHMPLEYKKALVETARKMSDVQFIWKYEDDDLKTWDLPGNLYLSKWTPQTSLLADSRLSLFVTHGGLSSTIEIAYSGTPAIVVPLFADQSRNAQVLIRQGIGEKFSKFDLENSEKLEKILRKMLGDSKHKEAAKKVSNLLHNVPFKPKELLLRNIEFVAKFGNLPQLDPYGRQLSFIQYYLLDVLAIVALVLLVVIVVAIWIIKKIASFIFKKKKSDGSGKKNN